MIINGNNFNQNLFNKNKQFEDQKFNSLANEKPNPQMENTRQNNFTKDIFSYQHVNQHNHNDTYDKSLAILQDRLDKNLITLEEFNKKCEHLGKKRRETENNYKNF